MSNDYDAAGSQFEAKALRALGIGGIVVAIWQAAYLAFLTVGWGLFRRSIAPGVTELNNAAIAMIYASTALLLIGCIGILQGRRWGRTVLLIYAFLTLGVHILTLFVETYQYLQYAGTDTPKQIAQFFCMLVDNRVSSSVLPAVIIVLFRYLRVLRHGAPTGAFEAIPATHRENPTTWSP